jgi:hypothetical protein
MNDNIDYRRHLLHDTIEKTFIHNGIVYDHELVTEIFNQDPFAYGFRDLEFTAPVFFARFPALLEAIKQKKGEDIPLEYLIQGAFSLIKAVQTENEARVRAASGGRGSYAHTKYKRDSEKPPTDPNRGD